MEKMLKLLILISLFHLNSATNSKMPVPVFLLDHAKTVRDLIDLPLTKLTQSQFKKLITRISQGSKVVLIFVEEELCMEHITKKYDIGTPFTNLHKGILNKTVKFIPSVIEPLKALMHYFPYTEEDVRFLSKSDLDTEFSIPRDDSIIFYSYFYFKDTMKPDFNLIKTHDELINKIYSSISSNATGPTTAFYTGKTNPIVAKKLKKLHEPTKRVEKKRNTDTLFATSTGLFRLTGVQSSTTVRRYMYDDEPQISAENWGVGKMSTRMTYNDFELEFFFSLAKSYWNIDYVALLEGGEEVGRTVIDARAPWGSSYICGETLVLVNTRDASSVMISQYQLQPYHNSTYDVRLGARNVDGETPAEGGTTTEEDAGTTISSKSGNLTFGASVNCSPCFTAPILAGLMVTFICLTILFFGINLLHNVRGIDKFDDPNSFFIIMSEERSGKQ